MRITRRRFGAIAGGAAAACTFGGGCRVKTEPSQRSDGRLTQRPRAGIATPVGSAAGRTQALGLDRGRDAILQLPAKAGAAPLPLLVLFHGAGGTAEGVLRRVGTAADQSGIAVLAPDSRESTWDAIRDGFGRDVAFVDRALGRVFDTVSVDAGRIAAGGFSDGATYALSIGLINGDLFRRIVAFSPGFLVDGPAHGTPQIFVSHGTSDPILPIEHASRMIVSALQKRGYVVLFREFDGGHQVPPAIASEAMQWLAAR